MNRASGGTLDLPSSLVQLRNAVWTGDTRDTRPDSDIRDGPAVHYAGTFSDKLSLTLVEKRG
jgi:hypothetical protein